MNIILLKYDIRKNGCPVQVSQNVICYVNAMLRESISKEYTVQITINRYTCSLIATLTPSRTLASLTRDEDFCPNMNIASLTREQILGPNVNITSRAIPQVSRASTFRFVLRLFTSISLVCLARVDAYRLGPSFVELNGTGRG